MSSTKVAEPPVDKSALIPKSERYRALAGSAVGGIVEWYDYFLYGTMSAIVFGPLFFPSDNPVVEQLLALTSFALAFAIRPIGGVLFSHMGDRIGRKKTLVVTLTLMGATTVGIGLVPTFATIGVAAPIILTFLRLLQGLALGGEWGGGLLMAVEYSPSKKRGFYGAIPQTGALIGLALGNLAVTGSLSIFSEEDFLSYGWRIPFLISIVLVLLGLWIRKAVGETPSFKRVTAERKTEKLPIAAIFKKNSREVFIVVGAKAIETGTFFLFATYTISHMLGLGYERVEALNAVLIAALIAVPLMLLAGSLSDRIGRKKVYGIGTVLAMAYVIPYFWLLEQGSWWTALVAIIIGFSCIWSLYGATLGSYFAESFPPAVRYTGVSLGYQVGAALFGGPLPLIATALLATYSSYLPIGAVIIAFGTISLIALAFTKDRTGQPLDD
ncbi:MHS family MFS transporter [Tessaracoccus sp. OS52]|uniref:MFS transporter n=1 Tax=Tessaracoccus sp. OS52 TaxID=2886691 RepID=UPI001D11C76C|nr:MFS transporter [Tessaracoccus sp. OS52]MCC2594193.1 MHS family MFS transporter [Tessaracoccus sp. OS52]